MLKTWEKITRKRFDPQDQLIFYLVTEKKKYYFPFFGYSIFGFSLTFRKKKNER